MARKCGREKTYRNYLGSSQYLTSATAFRYGRQTTSSKVFGEIRREKRLPFVPNFFKTLARAPQSMEATWSVYRGISTRGALLEALKEMIFVAISVAGGCKYCEAAHLAFCNLLSVAPGNLAALTENVDEVQPERTRDILRFSVKCALEPRNVDQADFAKLRKHGLADNEIIETVAMCGFSMYATALSLAYNPLGRNVLLMRASRADRWHLS
jgi:uncharacterized peroxidase-related enzyme